MYWAKSARFQIKMMQDLSVIVLCVSRMYMKALSVVEVYITVIL